MFRSRVVMLAITTIATLFCSALIVPAQSTPEGKQTTEVETQEDSTEKETEEKELDERPTFDFSLPGDNRTQSLALFFERPFKFSKIIEGKLSGNYFTTFTKAGNPARRIRMEWLYRKVSLDGSFSPDHTHIGLKGAPRGNGVEADILNLKATLLSKRILA